MNDANRGCHRKERHWTQAEAEQVRQKCEAKRPGTRLRSYFCEFCLGWHLTHTPEMRKAAS